MLSLGIANEGVAHATGKINEVRSFVEVYDDDKKGGVIAVELHLGDDIRRWNYGAGEKYEKDFFTRFVEKVDIDMRGRTPRVFIEIKDRPGEVNIRVGLRTEVFLYMDEGPALEFSGRRIFDTGRGENILELTREERRGDVPNSGTAALVAKSPGIPSAVNAGQAIFTSRLWQPGSKLTVAFQGGTAEMRRRTAMIASEWTDGTNLSFDFGVNLSTPNDNKFYEWPAQDPATVHQIRVSFDETMGNYSYIGRDSLSESVSPTKPSMNLAKYNFDGDEDQLRSAVLHEFGHALGFTHMFNHPDAHVDFLFDDDAGRPGIYSLLGGPPNNWSRSQIDNNLKPHPPQGWMPLAPTADSVMMYSFPETYFRAGRASPWWIKSPRSSLSVHDRRMIRLIYPPFNVAGKSDAHEIVAEALKARDLSQDRVRALNPAAITVDRSTGWYPLRQHDDRGRVLDSTWKMYLNLSEYYICSFKATQSFDHQELGPKRMDENFGTGILVGPSLILTSNHVIPSEIVANKCEVVTRGAAGEFHFEFAQDSVVHCSGIDDLDFSLLRVSADRNQRLPGVLQGYYPLPTSLKYRGAMYSDSMPISVLHHPDGQTDLARDFDGRTLMGHPKFVAYKAMTKGGSSGGAVFNDEWWLMALHRGRTQVKNGPGALPGDYAQGVRIDVIIDSIRQKCDSAVLSELKLTRD